ncbi:MAG: hypothetical protein IJQ16_08510, partial [Selenomonadaceae bacterium]|nr:hypothetical protein [Selenomonadaceae bacterium]
ITQSDTLKNAAVLKFNYICHSTESTQDQSDLIFRNITYTARSVDLITDDIREVFRSDYPGKVLNSYDNKKCRSKKEVMPYAK